MTNETLKQIDEKKLKKILDNHSVWLNSAQEKGEKANLAYHDLQGVNLQGTDLRQANFQGSNLQKSNLQRANLEDANLQDTHLQETNLQDCILLGAHLQGAGLTKSNLRNANLSQAELQNATLNKANLIQAKLQGAILIGSKLEEAKLQNADLTAATIKGVRMYKANLCNAILSKATIEDTNLEEAKLSRTMLNETMLKNVSLKKTDLSFADLTNLGHKEKDKKTKKSWFSLFYLFSIPRKLLSYIIEFLEFKSEDPDFDDTYINSTRFSPEAKDKWSILRRDYTGPNFTIHLLLIIVFILPYVLKTSFWLGVNKVEKRIEIIQTELKEVVPKIDTTIDETINKIDTTIQEIEDLNISIKRAISTGKNIAGKEINNLSTQTRENTQNIAGTLEKLANELSGIDFLNKIVSQQIVELREIAKQLRDEGNKATSNLDYLNDKLQRIDPIKNTLLKLNQQLYEQKEIGSKQSKELLKKMSEIKPCLSNDCKSYYVIELLLGLDNGLIHGVFPVLLIIYNALRLILTWKISALRETEQRSNYSPSKSNYSNLFFFHQVRVIMMVFAFGFALLEVLPLLIQEVSLPVK